MDRDDGEHRILEGSIIIFFYPLCQAVKYFFPAFPHFRPQKEDGRGMRRE